MGAASWRIVEGVKITLEVLDGSFDRQQVRRPYAVSAAPEKVTCHNPISYAAGF